MNRLTERLTTVGAIVLVVAVAVVTLLVLGGAQDRGVEALEKSKRNEVDTTARSFNQRQVTELTAAAGLLTGLEFQFTSEGADQEKLDQIFDFIEGADLRTGLFLVDLQGSITSGILLGDGAIGSTYERPGFQELVTSPDFYQPPFGGILPVGDGITTNLPTTAVVYPVFPPDPTGVEDLQGFVVAEADVTSDSAFSTEIEQLTSAETDAWRFLDENDTVVASTEASELAEPIADAALADLEPGLHDLDGRLVVVAPVPISGWRVVFSQERSEFQSALTGPLQDAGTLLVALLLLSGIVVVTVLVRQLRNARAEQQRLKALNETQEEFTSIVSHELRTPVAGVLGFLQTTLDHWTAMSDGERQENVRRAVSNARRLQALTRDVLDAEGIERGGLVYSFDEVDLRDEVEIAVEAARDRSPSRAIELRLPTAPLLTRLDQDRFQQVLTNLLDNAEKNSPSDDPILIELTEARDGPVGRAQLTVSDSGPGIDPATADRMFEKFVRGRGSTVAGTGLGLYIAHKIVDAHGGRIWADTEGQGAMFHVELPTVDRVEDEPASSP